MDKQLHALPKLAVILGPTACGKTGLSLDIATAFNAEIISADSMQIYCGMDIGTAKIRPEEMRSIPHHLLDICQPQQSFSVADFRSHAQRAIADITARGKLPLLVGGTGLYIAALLHPYNYPPEIEADPAVREQLYQRLEQEGRLALHQQLAEVDPAAAARIHPNDTHRLLRALEVYVASGCPLSEWQQGSELPSPYDSLVIGLNMPRERLYQRIDERVEQMISDGLAEEVRGLLEAGTAREAQSMQGLGYRQLVRYIDGEMSLEEAAELLKRDTRRYAKRQLTWFKRYNDINWFDADHYRAEGALAREVSALLAHWLKEE